MIRDLSHYTFRELKKELTTKIHNPIQELYIRTIMRDKYREYTKKRNAMKNRHKKKQQKKRKYASALVDDILDDIEAHTQQPVSRDKPITMDSKYADEIQRDDINNNLMDRIKREAMMVSEDRTHRHKSTVIPPYSGANGTTYAPYVSGDDGDIDDFDTTEIWKKKA